MLRLDTRVRNLVAMADTSPTVRHRRLAAELRRLRERARLSQEQVAAALGVTRAKVIKIEGAQTMPSVEEVEAVLDLYGGNDSRKAALLQLARDIRKRGWWTAYDDVYSGGYAECEDAADKIRTWQIEIVPGLLQSQDYALALIRSAYDDPAEVDRRLEVRRMRQMVLTRPTAPTLQALLHESVLRSPIGGIEVMRDQLRALLLAAEQPNISIRVMPATVGLRAGLGEGSFTIFDFSRDVDQGVVHLETVAGGVYVEDVEQVTRCNVVYESISGVCLPEEESAAMIAALIEE